MIDLAVLIPMDCTIPACMHSWRCSRRRDRRLSPIRVGMAGMRTDIGLVCLDQFGCVFDDQRVLGVLLFSGLDELAALNSRTTASVAPPLGEK